MRSVIFSQCRDRRMGMVWLNLGALTTARAREFWIRWSRVIWHLGRLNRNIRRPHVDNSHPLFELRMYYLFIDLLVCVHWKSVCLHWKNRRFTAFLDSKLHTRLAIVTINELGLAFPPRNLPKKFRPDPSTFYLVIVATDRQTDRQTDWQTYAGENIIPRESFRGDNKNQSKGCWDRMM